ncbi:MAG TPA: chromosome partitioning protein, partial [Pseudomonas sp.]|nr:chromosome partitioning protein [Pseudomonas sp.]
SSDLPLPAPELIAEDEGEDDIILIEETAEESEEEALARAIAEEKELEA